MVTLTILAIIFAILIIGVALLSGVVAAGGALIYVFSDIILAVLLVVLIVKIFKRLSRK